MFSWNLDDVLSTFSLSPRQRTQTASHFCRTETYHVLITVWWHSGGSVMCQNYREPNGGHLHNTNHFESDLYLKPTWYLILVLVTRSGYISLKMPEEVAKKNNNKNAYHWSYTIKSAQGVYHCTGGLTALLLHWWKDHWWRIQDTLHTQLYKCCCWPARVSNLTVC